MKIREKFEELEERGEGAYMPHIYYGDPSVDFSLKEIETLVENGADFLEFGIPFSDPTADGPTFQEACERALDNGVTPKACLEGIEKIRNRGYELPIVVTTYYNTPFKFGTEEFFERLSKVGVQGIIIPNMPIEESEKVLESARREGISVIYQVTPNTTEERLKIILEKFSGFLYVINFEGVTGVRNSVFDSTLSLIDLIGEESDIPLMAGFGISERTQAEKLVSSGADGVITGSALAKIYGQKPNAPEEKLDKIGEFARAIKEGCIKGYKKKK